MKQRLLLVAAISLASGLLAAGVAGAGSTPTFTVGPCGSTGFVQVTWKAKLSQVKFEWVATSGTFNPTVVPVSPTPPKGLASASPLGQGASRPTSVTVTFTLANGSLAAPPTSENCG